MEPQSLGFIDSEFTLGTYPSSNPVLVIPQSLYGFNHRFAGRALCLENNVFSVTRMSFQGIVGLYQKCSPKPL